jgi:hypothetical protein
MRTACIVVVWSRCAIGPNPASRPPSPCRPPLQPYNCLPARTTEIAHWSLVSGSKHLAECVATELDHVDGIVSVPCQSVIATTTAAGQEAARRRAPKTAILWAQLMLSSHVMVHRSHTTSGAGSAASHSDDGLAPRLLASPSIGVSGKSVSLRQRLTLYGLGRGPSRRRRILSLLLCGVVG